LITHSVYARIAVHASIVLLPNTVRHALHLLVNLLIKAGSDRRVRVRGGHVACVMVMVTIWMMMVVMSVWMMVVMMVVVTILSPSFRG
jgi:hypothetical protein